jgi:hypothetical protein
MLSFSMINIQMIDTLRKYTKDMLEPLLNTGRARHVGQRRYEMQVGSRHQMTGSAGRSTAKGRSPAPIIQG